MTAEQLEELLVEPNKVTGWKPKSGSVYFYNPDPEWLANQSEDDIDTVVMVNANLSDGLVNALTLIKQICNPGGDIEYIAESAITAYREVSK